MLDRLSRHLKYSFRTIRRNPGFSGIAIFTLALGIGVNTAVFSVVNAVLLRPLPYVEPERLVLLYETNVSTGNTHDSVSGANFVDWKNNTHAFSSLAASQDKTFTLGSSQHASSINGELVTPETLTVLGLRPIIGRNFDQHNSIMANHHVAIISNELWHRNFGGRSSVLGQEIRLDSELYSVIGVLPAHFRMPAQLRSNQECDVIIPYIFADKELANRGNHVYDVFARVRDGITLSQARLDADRVARQLSSLNLENRGRGINVSSLLDEVVGSFRYSLVIIFAAAGLILLITCANLANAQLAKGLSQHREIELRFALGATRFEIALQLVLQTLLLAWIGCLVSIFVAQWSLKILASYAPQTLPRAQGVTLDGTSLAFCIVVATAAGLLFGLLPSLPLSRNSYFATLNLRGAVPGLSGSLSRYRDVLIVLQVSLSVVLLVTSSLLIRSFSSLSAAPLGFTPEHVLAAGIPLSQVRYPNQESRLRFFSSLSSRMRTLPGVEAIGYTNQLPLRGGWSGSFALRDPESPANANDDADFQIAGDRYFSALNISLLRGRTFTDADTLTSAPVVVVNNAFARRYWPRSSPVKQQFIRGDKTYTIIGVVGDVRLEGRRHKPNIEVYFAATQAQALPVSPYDVALKVIGEPLHMANALRQTVSALDAEQPVTNIAAMSQLVTDSEASIRFSTVLLGGFAVLALILAITGIYGIISYLVIQRSSEIAIRICLGAPRTKILQLIVGRISVLMVIGLASGCFAASSLTGYVSNLFAGGGTYDLGIVLIVVLLLSLAGLVGALKPALRAIRTSPLASLRGE